MALQGIQPFIHVSDANGNPIVGAKLYVYNAETTTDRAIYSDDDLTASLTNPLTSDSSGKFPRFYMAAGIYKLVCKTSALVELWTYDNIDTGLSAGSGALPIAAGGTGATTAAAARSNLGAASSSELSDLADDISTLTNSIQNIVSAPQGYLTAQSGVIVPTADVIAATAIYYEQDSGNLCPIWDGVQFNVKAFDPLTLTLSSNHVANGIYDCFVIDHAGDAIIVTGPVWNTVTAGSCARGTGAGTTELARVGGLLTNKYAMTARNGATTYPVDANEGTFVGSLFIDGTAGQVTCHRTVGLSRKWGVSNAFRRRPITLGVTDPTTTWTYNSTTIRASRGQSTNSLTTFTCLAEEEIDIEFIQAIDGAGAQQAQIGIGFNSTTAISGKRGTSVITSGAGGHDVIARYNAPPALGINVYTALERVFGAGTVNYIGTDSYMLLSARWNV